RAGRPPDAADLARIERTGQRRRRGALCPPFWRRMAFSHPGSRTYGSARRENPVVRSTSLAQTRAPACRTSTSGARMEKIMNAVTEHTNGNAHSAPPKAAVPELDVPFYGIVDGSEARQVFC